MTMTGTAMGVAAAALHGVRVPRLIVTAAAIAANECGWGRRLIRTGFSIKQATGCQRPTRSKTLNFPLKVGQPEAFGRSIVDESFTVPENPNSPYSPKTSPANRRCDLRGLQATLHE